jgi:uncharacterized protein
VTAPLLAVTIHDVAPRWLSEVRTLRSSLAHWGVARVTLLAVPHFHHGVRLVDHSATRAWLTACAEHGDEIALHGYHHVQHGAPTSLLDRARARLWTAGEGECLRPAAPLAELLRRGRAELTRILPLPPAGFVAPAWLEPRGFALMLARLGFSWHETSRFVETLASSPRDTPHRVVSPAIGYATRTPLREALSLAWARALSATAACLPALRVAVHPADLGSSRVMASLERVVRASVRDSGRDAARARRAVTTSELLQL